MSPTDGPAAERPSQRRDIPPHIPVVTLDHSLPSVALAHWQALDDLASRSSIYWNDAAHGYWMLLDYAAVKEAYQTPGVFGSDSILVSDPEPQHKWIPTMTNPPEHVKYRQVLNPTFSPVAVARLEAQSRASVNTIIDGFVADGRVEVMHAFCGEVPTTIFLHILGLPPQDAPRMAGWVAEVFDNMHAVDRSRMLGAMAQIDEYYAARLAARRAEPDDPADDIVELLCRSTIDGVALSDAEILNMCNVMTLAGLDTVRAQLGHALLHFATHPDDRARLAREPELWPSAVEELLRLHAIVTNDGRKLARDIEFHGCPMRKGDMVMLSLGPACRDASQFERPLEFVMDRDPNRHLAFGAGPHRCLGSHLARMEMLVALQEWHARIPDYRVAPGSPGMERGSQLSLLSLELEWDR